jgi:hypothetical protein
VRHHNELIPYHVHMVNRSNTGLNTIIAVLMRSLVSALAKTAGRRQAWGRQRWEENVELSGGY